MCRGHAADVRAQRSRPRPRLGDPCPSRHRCSSGTSCRPRCSPTGCSPGRGATAIVAVASLLFYTWGAGRYTALLLSAIGGQLRRGAGHRRRPAAATGGLRRAVLYAAVIWDLGILAIWKYAGFASQQIDALSGGAGAREHADRRAGPAHRHLLLHVPPHLLRGGRVPAQPAARSGARSSSSPTSRCSRSWWPARSSATTRSPTQLRRHEPRPGRRLRRSASRASPGA